MLPDRAKFYDSLKNYNTLQHAKQNSMYGLEYDEHSYYKREGEPGNYRYYWTKQEYEAHLAELERQRNKNMQAAQNAEADRWKRNDQNQIKEQQVKNNSQANAEADRWKRQEEQRKQQEQDKKWQQQQEDAKKRVAESAKQKLIDKNQGNDGESERWKRYEAQKLKEKQMKDAQDRIKQREIAKKKEGNDPEAERWARQERQQIWEQNQKDAQQKVERAEAANEDRNARDAAIKKATDSSVKYNKEVEEINKATESLENNDNKKYKDVDHKVMNEKKEDLFDMTDYYRKNYSNGDNESFKSEFEKVKKTMGNNAPIYVQGGDIIYFDPKAEKEIKAKEDEYQRLANERAKDYEQAFNSNADPKTKAIAKNQYQDKTNKMESLKNEIDHDKNELREKAYANYESILDQMYMYQNNSLKDARERKQLEHEQWVKEQQGSWTDQIKKKVKKFFS